MSLAKRSRGRCACAVKLLSLIEICPIFITLEIQNGRRRYSCARADIYCGLCNSQLAQCIVKIRSGLEFADNIAGVHSNHRP
jgi:hypothetical protein